MAVEPYAIYHITLENKAHIGISRLPGRGGDLAGDVSLIAAWGAACVVSLTEADEMARKGGAGLPEALSAMGIAWRSFPVRDYGAPQKADTSWPPVSAELHAMLDKGQAVLLHCAGGRGRSGMVALRLVVERGMLAGDALAMIRAVRPGAVETAEQEAWGGAGNKKT